MCCALLALHTSVTYQALKKPKHGRRCCVRVGTPRKIHPEQLSFHLTKCVNSNRESFGQNSWASLGTDQEESTIECVLPSPIWEQSSRPLPGPWCRNHGVDTAVGFPNLYGICDQHSEELEPTCDGIGWRLQAVRVEQEMTKAALGLLGVRLPESPRLKKVAKRGLIVSRR